MAVKMLGRSDANNAAASDLDALLVLATNGDANATTALNSYPQTNGRTVASLSAYLANNAVFNVRDYGAVGDGVTDDTSAFAACISAANSARGAVFVPDGNFLITSTLTIPSHTGFVGLGSGRTKITHTPTANGTCLRVSSGAVQSLLNRIGGFQIYSPDTTYTKVALELIDVSSCIVHDLYVNGAGSGTPSGPYYSGGTGSVALRTKGREVSSFSDLRLVADIAINIAANPNTAATDGEDADHFHFYDCYLLSLGNPIIKVDDGLGVMQLTIDGYQAWVGGTSGFYMNDTRVAPTILTRGISISNVRREQGTDVNGYGIDISVTTPSILGIQLNNLLLATGEQGVHVDGVLHLDLNHVICATAAGKDALRIENPKAGGTLRKCGCLEQPGSVVSLDADYDAILIAAHETGTTQGPSDAFYAATRAATSMTVVQVQAAQAATLPAVIAGGGGGADRVDLIGNAAGNGARIRSMNTGASDFEPMDLAFETLTINYRTGAATVASAGAIGTTGSLSLTKGLFLAQDTGAAQTACKMFAGTGAPNNANGANGDFYFRGDGTAAGNTVIYHKEAGSWVALVTT